MKNYDVEKALSGLEEQIEALRNEASSLSSSILDQAQNTDWRAHADSLYRGASRRLRKARRYGRREGSHMADVVRENPAAASTATLAAVGLIGVGIWWLLRSDR